MPLLGAPGPRCASTLILRHYIANLLHRLHRRVRLAYLWSVGAPWCHRGSTPPLSILRGEWHGGFREGSSETPGIRRRGNGEEVVLG